MSAEATVDFPHRERTPAEERALGLRQTPPEEIGLPKPEDKVGYEEEVQDEAVIEKTPRQEAEEELDALEPKGAHKTWTFSDGEGHTYEYVQKPLSYFGKMEFFSTMGNAVDLALANEGMSMSSLFGARGMNAEQLFDTETFMRTIARLVVFAPDLLQDSFCIWLSVPRGDRNVVKGLMQETLEDDDAMEMIEIFIDQNMEAMSRFFLEQIPRITKRAKSKMPAADSLPLKRSKPSRPSIQSR
jgi:hypothetical protein